MTMPRHERSLPINNATLKTLMPALGVERSRVLVLMHQLQVSNLQDEQKADILVAILASVIHLHTHCDEDLQGAIADELDSLPE